MTSEINLLFFLAAFGLGAGGAVVFSCWGSGFGFSDRPNARSSHTVAVPKGGGIGLLFGFMLTSVYFQVTPMLWGPVVMLSCLGLLGDRIELSPFLRLAVHLSLSLIFFAGINGGEYDFINYLLAAFFWSVFFAATANFYNFMDGINGIAGITGMIAFSFCFYFISGKDPHSVFIVLSGCIVFSCAGFLPFNVPSARVFMGDVGSLLLGFLFAGIACLFSSSAADFGVFVCFLLPFYADAITTLWFRIKDGENILESHRRHLYQLLANELSEHHWKISLIYGVLQIFTGISGLVAQQAGAWAVFLFITMFFLLFFVVSRRLRKRLEYSEVVVQELKQEIFSRNIPIVLMTDLVVVMFSLWASCAIRFNNEVPLFISENLKNILPLIVIIKLSAFSYYDFYRGMWRYTSIPDLLNIIKACIVSTLLIVSTILFVHGFEGFPRSVFVVDSVVTILLISFFRLFVRFYYERLNTGLSFDDFSYASIKNFFFPSRKSYKKLLIIGAGDCGEKILREIQNNPAVKYDVVGFLDDNPKKIGKKIHGVLVLNSIDYLGSAAQRTGAEELLIAVPSATAHKMKRIVDICERSGLKFKTIPNMGELINGTVSVGAIRDVSFRDLLGRKPVALNQEQVKVYLNGKRILVTGAGGSIGSELCRQISRFSPEKLIVVDWAETPLFEIDYELKRYFPELHSVPVLADIQDQDQVHAFFREHQPEVVFHAAAYKHVAMLEEMPWKAVMNNIFGTVIVAQAAKAFKADSFVFVSTDKAVTPTSIMGVSKRIAEIFIQNQNCNADTAETKFITVRFGNVAGSAGSVVPLFKKQIKDGGPVTVTHPEVTRFFMTIPEACQLILQAGAMGHGREIFILEMGRPIRILDMARDLIRLYGYEPDKEIKIEFIGLRKGEKLFEDLVSEGEDVLPTSHESIMVLQSRQCSLDLLNGSFSSLREYALKQDEERIIALFQTLVPDYVPATVVDSCFPPN